MTFIDRVRERFRPTPIVVVLVLFLAAMLGERATVPILGLLVIVVVAAMLMQRPVLGLLALIPAALAIPLQFGSWT
jgi:hypothetical protein